MADETSKAQTARPGGETIFGKIIRREIPTELIHDDDKCVAFHDINPVAPVHVLVVPKKAITGLDEAGEGDKELIGHLILVATKLAGDLKLDDGYRLTINSGRHGGQSVFHLHVHIMGGRQMSWPPG